MKSKPILQFVSSLCLLLNSFSLFAADSYDPAMLYTEAYEPPYEYTDLAAVDSHTSALEKAIEAQEKLIKARPSLEDSPLFHAECIIGAKTPHSIHLWTVDGSSNRIDGQDRKFAKEKAKSPEGTETVYEIVLVRDLDPQLIQLIAAYRIFYRYKFENGSDFSKELETPSRRFCIQYSIIRNIVFGHEIMVGKKGLSHLSWENPKWIYGKHLEGSSLL